MNYSLRNLASVILTIAILTGFGYSTLAFAEPQLENWQGWGFFPEDNLELKLVCIEKMQQSINQINSHYTFKINEVSTYFNDNAQSLCALKIASIPSNDNLKPLPEQHLQFLVADSIHE